MIAALFVQTRGAYFFLPGVDPWDVHRDARLYAGPHPVVAHPPCARWCKLAGQVETRGGAKRGDDAGCFAAALTAVRVWGGVLEHPAHTAAFAAFNLPRPPARGWQRTLCGGWVCEVDQAHYGHRVRKPTWLYARGMTPPALTWGEAPEAPRKANHTTRAGEVAYLSKRERSATPEAFRDALLGIARGVARTEAA